MNRKFFASVSAIITGVLLLHACTKIDSTEIGVDLIPDVDNVHTFELILPVETNNFYLPDSTIITASASHAVGIMEDAVFGKTVASMYLNFTPSSYGFFPFGNETAVLDSVVLSLAYVSVYGDSTTDQHFDVYQINTTNPDNFKNDSLFEISAQIDIDPTILGSGTVRPIYMKDTIMYVNNKTDTVYTNLELRIPLDLNWANQFLSYDTATQYKNDSIFRSHFKGLAIVPNESSVNRKALTYWNITNNSKTRLTFYYTYTRTVNEEAVLDTASYAMQYTYSSGFYQATQANLIERTPGGDYAAYVENGTPDDDLLFIQTSPGSYAEVIIPGLDTFQHTNRVIHRAELIFEQIPSNESNYFARPPLLFVDAISLTGDSVFTIRRDFQLASSYFGYDITTLEGTYKDNSYRFNLSRYLQSIVTDKLPYYKLRVYVPYATYPYYEDPVGSKAALNSFLFINDWVAGGRVVLGGGSHATQPAKLRIIYSKL